jgi:hypothetical protein
LGREEVAVSEGFQYFVRELEPWAMESRDIPPVSVTNQSTSSVKAWRNARRQGMANLLRLIVRVDSGYGVEAWAEGVDVAPTDTPVSTASAPFFLGIAILLVK